MKVCSVLGHFLGRDDFEGLVALDVGCSTGFTAGELHKAGARVMGVDIDEPGLASAGVRFGTDVGFFCADGSALPLSDQCVDIVVFNHIYEHVVDADAVLAEIHRVVRPDGVVYLGFANKRVIMEPHYGLPFLSWLPRPIAHRYVRATGRAPYYHEQFRTRRNLRRMVIAAGFHAWDYTYTVLCDADIFHARDMVPQRLVKAPYALWRAFSLILPTYIWVGTRGLKRPAGAATRHAPEPLAHGKPLEFS